MRVHGSYAQKNEGGENDKRADAQTSVNQRSNEIKKINHRACLNVSAGALVGQSVGQIAVACRPVPRDEASHAHRPFCQRQCRKLNDAAFPGDHEETSVQW